MSLVLSRLVKLARVSTCAGAFLAPRLAPVGGASRTLSTAASARAAAFVPRASYPRAFESGDDTPLGAFESGDDAPLGEIDNLSDAQIKTLLDKLQTIQGGLTPSEVDRVSVVENASPSVAFIQTSVQARGSPFSPQMNEYPLGAGSGFVWDDQGHVITNYHVVAGGPMMARGDAQKLPRKVMVKLQGCDEQVEATVVGFEADKDLAVLKVNPEKACTLKPLELGSSSSLRVGQNVLAIGNPFGLDFSLTTGVVSALGRDIQGFGGRPIKDCLQTDAAINPGNSGGPLLDSRGRLIGVNTMIYAPNGVGANVGIGFAIPVDTVRRVINQIIAFGQNARPSLGINVLPDADRMRYSRSLGRKLEGAIVAEVVKGSPAEELKLSPTRSQFTGILLGDMITAVNGLPIKTNEDLLCAVEESEPEQPITVTVMRNCDPERMEELTATPVQRKSLAYPRE